MPAELDNQAPEMDQEMDASADMGSDPESMGAEGGHGDQEGAMAKQELIKLANYATNLQEHIEDDEQLEAWVQSKITIAATNIASVYHYLAYEKKIGEYGEALNSAPMSESKRRAIKNWLMEAKSKVKELKKIDAEKKKVMEGPLSGGERACTECGGTGMVYEEPKQVPDHVKGKVEKYKRLVTATKAAHKRMDNNHNGIPDDEEVDESFGDTGPKEMKTGDTKKTRTGVMTKTDTGVTHKNTSYHDDGEAEEKSGKGVKSHAKAQSAAEKKDRAPAQKQSPKSAKTWGMKDGSKFDNRDKQMDESVADKKKNPFAKKVVKEDADRIAMLTNLIAGYEAEYKTATGPNKTNLARTIMAFKQQLEAETEAARSAQMGVSPALPVQEGKPSAGLSKAKKSATVKKAKKGGDIGKPGKGFDKLAKKAGGGEKGQKIAAAAMWKNIKETTAYLEEKKAAEKKADKDYDGDGKVESGKDEYLGSKIAAAKKAGKLKECGPDCTCSKCKTVNESADVSRLRELTGRLNRSEKPTLVENREVDQLKALTNLFKG